MNRWMQMLGCGAIALAGWLETAPACPAQTAEGPSLLSRGMAAELPRARPETVFRPSLGAMSGYDNGPLTTDLDRGEGPFQELQGGLEARRTGRLTSLRLDYQFGVRHYSRLSRLDRSNHDFSLDTRFRLSRRLALVLRDVAASSSFGGSFREPSTNLSAGFFADGGPEVFHSRTIANTALADLIFSPSARTSVSVAGDGFTVQRQFRGLADVVGWRARADIAHRYSRHRTLTLSSSFTHFDHSRSFGGADYAVYAVGHSWRLGRSSELDLLGGAGHLQSAGVRAVQLDPEIAKLLGTARGAEIFRLNTWTPHLLAAWTQGLGRAEWRLQFSRLVSDGGGLSGLARQNQGSLTWTIPLARSGRFSATTLVRAYRSLDTLIYDSTTAAGGATLARRLGPRAEAVLRYQYSFYDFQRGLLRNFHRHQVAAGMTFYFQDLPPTK